MTIHFGCRLASFALMACTQACTLTGDDYSPAPFPGGDAGGIQCLDGSCLVPVTPETAMEPADSSTGADAPGDASASAVAEAPGLGALLEGEEAAGIGMAAAGSDAGASVGDAAPPNAALPELLGWAGVPGLGLATTSGGGAAPTVVVQTAEELIELAARPEPLTLAIEGALDVGTLELTSDKTLFGLNGSATLRGGIIIGGAAISGVAGRFVRNVIVHNLRIDAATSAVEGDGIQIRRAHHVWLDHLEIKDAADGLVDIIDGSDFVTVSHSRFLYTAAASAPTHRFATFVDSDTANATPDRRHLNVTWHHNWWSDDVSQALRGRFGNIHLFNNLFASPDNENVVSAGQGAALLVENNLFVGVAAPHDILPGSLATLEASGNVYVDTTGPRAVSGTVARPPYEYQLQPALASLVTGDAGPR